MRSMTPRPASSHTSCQQCSIVSCNCPAIIRASSPESWKTGAASIQHASLLSRWFPEISIAWLATLLARPSLGTNIVCRGQGKHFTVPECGMVACNGFNLDISNIQPCLSCQPHGDKLLLPPPHPTTGVRVSTASQPDSLL